MSDTTKLRATLEQVYSKLTDVTDRISAADGDAVDHLIFTQEELIREMNDIERELRNAASSKTVARC